ncbi:homologous recombination OB-fold protein [Poeciliopsis prolifica]|uniref:homologous recombination OB-fold protein n=1 Tax=Poeciliopsis prolifica TaxID=188132 RepID=UPI002413C0F2|nr:homologous recombination OB-fold protein [Poeciliopsis prolifica]
MTCKLSGLFSLDEDFDDEDVLGRDWSPCSVAGPSKAAAAVPSCSLRASSVSHRDQEKTCHQPTGEKLAELCNGAVHSGAAQTVAQGLRQISSSSASSNTACTAQDDFDDWDIDLADLDECDSQTRQLSTPAAAEPPSSVKTLRPSTYVTIQTPPTRNLRDTSSYCSSIAAPQNLSSAHLQPPSTSCASFPAAPPQPQSSFFRIPAVSPAPSSFSRIPAVSPAPSSFSRIPAVSPAPSSFSRIPAVSPAPSSFSRIPAVSPAPSSFSRTPSHPQQLQKPWMTPQATSQARSLFNMVSPGPPASVNSSALSPHPLHTPVLTNRLVQLVSASSKLPRKRQRSEAHQPQTRRFPGPAGLLPQQPQGQNLDEIVVSVPSTPSHGAVARLQSQCSSSQSEEEEFSGCAWAAMKAEMGLDERNPSCFLHTYSVVMVLRKAALKQLPRNKVPNMAVLLKSIIHTNADAKAVFKDPTGEIQGTVHRRLLEERCEELKAGAVLLLKQVGVFSPSHRNHYLNVTPNNLLRIYSPAGVSLSTQLPPFVLEPTVSSPTSAPAVPREPVSLMQLEFDEEDDEGKKDKGCTEGGEALHVQRICQGNKSVNGSRNPAQQEQDWDADDDLDKLLGEIQEDAYSF